MTVTSTTAIAGPYDGDDVTVEFDYGFYIAADTELVVTLADTDGVETVQTLTTHYTVDIAEDGTGTFTMGTAPATGEIVTGTLGVPMTQATNLLNKGTFHSEIHETAWDKLTRIAQQLGEKVDRCLKVGSTTGLTGDDVTLTDYATTAMLNARAPVLLSSATATLDPAITVYSADTADYDFLQVEFFEVFAGPAVVPLLYFTDINGNPHADNISHHGRGMDAAGTEKRWDSDDAVAYAELSHGAPSATGALYGRLDLFRIPATKYSAFHGIVSYRSVTDQTATVGGAAEANVILGGIQITGGAGSISGTARLWGMPKGS